MNVALAAFDVRLWSPNTCYAKLPNHQKKQRGSASDRSSTTYRRTNAPTISDTQDMMQPNVIVL